MEFHAWLNPYRTSTAYLTFDFKQNVAGTNGDCIVDYDEKALDTYKETFFGSLKTKAEVNGKTYKTNKPQSITCLFSPINQWYKTSWHLLPINHLFILSTTTNFQFIIQNSQSLQNFTHLNPYKKQ
jgi:hypothetical protein